MIHLFSQLLDSQQQTAASHPHTHILYLTDIYNNTKVLICCVTEEAMFQLSAANL